MQIAIVLPDEQVDEIDRLVPSVYRSRAEVVRIAVAAWIADRRAREVDARYERAYLDVPQSSDDIDAGRATAGPCHPWDELEW
jgi:Arc/MetJ-type ribon-helix-helix transcriptional regulator